MLYFIYNIKCGLISIIKTYILKACNKFFFSFLESRIIKNVHDSRQNLHSVYDDPRRPLCEGQSVPQQHARGGCHPVHQRSAQLPSTRGEIVRCIESHY